MNTKVDLRLPSSHQSVNIPKAHGTWSDVAHVIGAKNTEKDRLLGRTGTPPYSVHHPPAFSATMRRHPRFITVQFSNWNVGSAAAWSALQLYKDLQGPERGLTELTLKDLDPETEHRTKVSCGKSTYNRDGRSITLSNDPGATATSVQIQAPAGVSLPEMLCDVESVYDELYEGLDNSYIVGRAVGAVSLRRFCDAWEQAYAGHIRCEYTPAEAARSFLHNAGLFEVQPW